MVDIAVVGEVALDVLADRYCRPGGVVYSALAGRAVGASTAIVGYVGQEGAAWVRELLASRSVDLSQLRTKDRVSTMYHVHNVDEVEPSSADRIEGGVPSNDAVFARLDARALLMYPYPPEILHQVMDSAPTAMMCLDLQYDLGPLHDIEGILKRCHIVFVSRPQAMRYFNAPTVDSLVDRLKPLGPAIVVVKAGLCGSTIYGPDAPITIPRLTSHWQQSVGAGDVYNAVFLATYLETGDLRHAGYCAAAAAAKHCEGTGSALLTDWDLEKEKDRDQFYIHPDTLTKAPVYLAAPFFTWWEQEVVDRTKAMLESHGITVHSPYHSSGLVSSTDLLRQSEVFREDCQAIDKSRAVVALLDGLDPGTLFEVGYAFKQSKPVIGLWTRPMHELNLMPAMAANIVRNYRQLITALLEEVERAER